MSRLAVGRLKAAEDRLDQLPPQRRPPMAETKLAHAQLIAHMVEYADGAAKHRQ